MRDFPATPVEMVASLWRNRELIKASTKREILGRYRGSFFGLLWSFFNPLLMLAVYTFIFSEVFNARWDSGVEPKTQFALVLFVGLIFFNFFSECLSRASSLVLSNPNYVKKVVFPLEILPFVTMLSAFYHALVSLGVWITAYVLFLGMPQVSIFFLPLIILPLALLIMGLTWALASLGVFLKDISQVIGVSLSILMFLSPIFYPASALPERYRDLLFLNPLTPAIEMSRSVLYWGIPPSISMLASYWAIASTIAWLGFAWFQKTRKGFADVI